MRDESSRERRDLVRRAKKFELKGISMLKGFFSNDGSIKYFSVMENEIVFG